MNISRSPNVALGYLGELYTMLELTKRGVYSTKLDPLHDYDLLTQGSLKIEVKASRLGFCYGGEGYKQESWQFRNHCLKLVYDMGAVNSSHTRRDRKCDFFVCVCFPKEEDKLDPCCYYIIPKEDYPRGMSLFIRKNSIHISKWEIYLNNWDLITQKEKEILPYEDIKIENNENSPKLTEYMEKMED